MNEETKIPRKNLEGIEIPFKVLELIPENAAVNYRIIPLSFEEGVLEVGMVDPENLEARDALQFIVSRSGMPFKIFQITEEDFKRAVKNYESLSGTVDKAMTEFEAEMSDKMEGVELVREDAKREGEDMVEEAPITKIVGVILQHAISGGASDIHIEPISYNKVRVRFRMDGILFSSLSLNMKVHNATVARIKILTNMKLDEKRKPQDGRFSAKIEGRLIDFRVSTMPSYFGEKVVLRVLDPDKKLINLDTLGFNEDHISKIKNAIKRPYGMILVTGPTGSGKTTTLYSMLSAIDRDKYNVISLEDPIEYDITGVNQSQVRPEIGYDFASGLRSILRQDPDVIMVGEIRDAETARLAIQASLTGHLVFSTLHTNNTIGVVPRLVDMGIEPYLIPPTLILALGQRLLPMLCEDAKDPIPFEDSLRQMVENQLADLPSEYRDKIEFPTEVYRAKRTPSCPSGTKGRLGVFEIMTMDRDLEKLILTKPGEAEIYNHLRQKGFISMKEDALLKSFQGLISFDEVNKL